MAASPLASPIRPPTSEQVLGLLRYALPDPQADVALEAQDYVGYQRNLRALPNSAERSVAEQTFDRFQDDPTSFYAQSQAFYLRNLSSHIRLPHLLARTSLLVTVAKLHSLQSYADWAAGSGRDCIAMARVGLDVTHLDVVGEGTDLARWRYAQRDLPITIADAEHPPESAYDLVSNFDCLEHLEDPVGVLGTIVGHVRPGGFLALAVDFYNFDLVEPGPHLPKNFVYGGILQLALEDLGMEGLNRRGTIWQETANAVLTIWRRPETLVLSETEITTRLRERTLHFLRHFRGFYDQEIARCEQLSQG